MRRFKKISEHLGRAVQEKALLFRIFDRPRPAYVAKVMLTDRIMSVLCLWAIPRYVRPNFVTVFRFVTIPFIIALLFIGDYRSAAILFILSAFSDAVDGALARTRNEITDWGIVFDPVADKLLIGSVGGMLIWKFLSPALALAVIGAEIVLVASAYVRFKGTVVPAKTVGKIKMILESLGVGLIFFFMLFHMPLFLLLARYALYLALLFAFFSLLIYRSI
ncbi:MAG: CDP-alcohol phosphatidyltransferase family protein [Patescibacteria group bacterium]|nr:CDP-alcohol phosphatidyltransferase family protein [Patescibacteria group bacterium]MDE1946168.1 CDP-alcohol phosphatidyltransferase family protein [Patescibacteria group bacterium]